MALFGLIIALFVTAVIMELKIQNDRKKRHEKLTVDVSADLVRTNSERKGSVRGCCGGKCHSRD